MLLTAFSAMLFGLIPLLTSVLYANGLDAVSVSFYRYVFIVPVLFLLCRLRNISLRITKNEAIFLLVHVSLFSTLTNLLLNASYVYIHTGVATTLHFLYPMFVILICKVFYRDRIDSNTKKALLLIGLGIACFFIHMKIDNVIGLMLALISGVTYAIYLVEMEKKGLSRMQPLLFSFYISLNTSIMLLIVNMMTNSIHLITEASTYFWLGVISIFSLMALICLQQGSKHIGAKMTSLFSLFEPITSLAAGVLILNEDLSIWKVIGCVFIFIAVMILALSKSPD